MMLHVVYRSSPGENRKDRPAFYSKMLALSSVVRAAEAAGAGCKLVFLNDGALPPERLDLMRDVGRVIEIAAGSNRGSFRRAAALPRTLRWDTADLVWFAEDDYLYTQQAFAAVLAAADALPDIDYFGHYCTVQLEPGVPGRPAALDRRAHPVLLTQVLRAETATWHRSDATTSSFGSRVASVRQDETILRTCPFTGGSWDTTTCLTLQGERAFDWPTLGADLLGRSAGPAGRARPAVLAPAKALVNVRAMTRRPSRRRTLVCTSPALATHLEEPYLAPGTDWPAVAEQVAEWAAGRGVQLPR